MITTSDVTEEELGRRRCDTWRRTSNPNGIERPGRHRDAEFATAAQPEAHGSIYNGQKGHEGAIRRSEDFDPQKRISVKRIHILPESPQSPSQLKYMGEQ